MKNNQFDTLIIGSGTSAYQVASRLNKAGQSVAIVDERPYGGTCALRGCQPKKYLVCNAEAVAMASHLVGQGIEDKPKTNWQALQSLKNKFLEGRSEAELKDWQKEGVTTFQERAKLTGPNEVQIGDHSVTAKHIVIATGATPRRAKIEGSEHIRISDDFLELESLPERITFIGGGYISFEFAHAAIHAGAKEVTIIHRSKHPLKAFDKDIVKVMLESSTHAGIKIILEESPTSVSAQDGHYTIHTDKGNSYDTDFIVEATGRVPNLTALEGDLGEVTSSPKGIEVNEYMQSTSNPSVYAIGDCAATPFMLATVADDEGKKAAANILKGNHIKMDYSVVPSAVFTIPSVGSVGLTEAQAQQKGLKVKINQQASIQWPSSKRIGETHSAYKVILDEETNQIIGAHIARHNASEVINILALAMKHQIPADELKDFMWAYPTMTSDIKYML